MAADRFPLPYGQLVALARVPVDNGWPGGAMNSDVNRWGSDGASFGDAADGSDHWLEDALRGVPLPEGFFARLTRLTETPPVRDDDRDRNGRCAPTRGLAGTAPRRGASSRDIRIR